MTVQPNVGLAERFVVITEAQVQSGEFTSFSDPGSGTPILLALPAGTDIATLIAYLSGVTPGTATASKAVILGASKNIDVLTVGTLTTTAPQIRTPGTGLTAFAGGGQASALALTKEFNDVTTVATAGDSVKLLAAVAGLPQTVRNSGANPLAVFPFSGDSINSLAANASIIIPVGGQVTFFAINTTVWKTPEAVFVPSIDSVGGIGITASGDYTISLTNELLGQDILLTFTDPVSTDASLNPEAVETVTSSPHVIGIRSGLVVITNAGLTALTLGNSTGLGQLTIKSLTAFAHTVTATNLLDGNNDLITFNNTGVESITLKGYGGEWVVIGSRGTVTVS